MIREIKIEHEKEWRDFISKAGKYLEGRGLMVNIHDNSGTYFVNEDDCGRKLSEPYNQKYIKLQLQAVTKQEFGKTLGIYMLYNSSLLICLETCIRTFSIREYLIPTELHLQSGINWSPEIKISQIVLEGLLRQIEKKFGYRMACSDWSYNELKEAKGESMDPDMPNANVDEYLEKERLSLRCPLTLLGDKSFKSLDPEELGKKHADAYEFLLKVLAKCNQPNVINNMMTSIDKVFEEVIGGA